MFKTLGRVLGLGRGRHLAGYDLLGNAYYELPSRSGSTDPRHTQRIIDWKEKRPASEYDQSSIPVQWLAWLRHTRRQAPSIEELQADAERIVRVRHNAKLLAERDAAWRASLLEAGPEDTSASSDARLLNSQSSAAPTQPHAGPSTPAPTPAPAAPPPAAEAGSSRRRRATTAVPTSEVRSELVDGDRVRRGADLASRTAPAPTPPAASQGGRRQAVLPNADAAAAAASASTTDDAETLVDARVRAPDPGVWEASKQRLRDRGQA